MGINGENKYDNRDCIWCRGSGIASDGLTCLRCDGDGRRGLVIVRRAYNLGWADAVAAVGVMSGELYKLKPQRADLRERLLREDAEWEREVERRLFGP